MLTLHIERFYYVYRFKCQLNKNIHTGGLLCAGTFDFEQEFLYNPEVCSLPLVCLLLSRGRFKSRREINERDGEMKGSLLFYDKTNRV